MCFETSDNGYNQAEYQALSSRDRPFWHGGPSFEQDLCMYGERVSLDSKKDDYEGLISMGGDADLHYIV